MAKKKKNNLLLLGLAAVGIYLLMRPKATAQNTLISQNPSAPIPTGAPIAMLPVSQSVQTLSQSGSVQIDPSEIQVIQNWISQLNTTEAAKVNAALPQMTKTEYDGLYDIIVNDWAKTGIATPTQTAFWNAWRLKYNII